MSQSNNNKQVIYSNNTTGPRLTTNLVSVILCIFSLLGAMELVLTCFKAIKAAFSFEFERICRSKFASKNANFDHLRHIPTSLSITC